MEVLLYWLPAHKTPNRADLPGSPHGRAEGCAWSPLQTVCLQLHGPDPRCIPQPLRTLPHTEKAAHTVWKRKLRNCDPTGLWDQTAAAEAHRASTPSLVVLASHSPARKRTLQPLKPIHKPGQSTLTHQRPRGPEAAKHKHGGTRR